MDQLFSNLLAVIAKAPHADSEVIQGLVTHIRGIGTLYTKVTEQKQGLPTFLKRFVPTILTSMVNCIIDLNGKILNQDINPGPSLRPSSKFLSISPSLTEKELKKLKEINKGLKEDIELLNDKYISLEKEYKELRGTVRDTFREERERSYSQGSANRLSILGGGKQNLEAKIDSLHDTLRGLTVKMAAIGNNCDLSDEMVTEVRECLAAYVVETRANHVEVTEKISEEFGKIQGDLKLIGGKVTDFPEPTTFAEALKAKHTQIVDQKADPMRKLV